MLQTLLWHLSSQNLPILPFLLSVEKFLPTTWQFIFSMETCSGSASWCSAESFPPLLYLELRILKQNSFESKSSLWRGTTPKAANAAVVTHRLHILWWMWLIQQETEPASVTRVKILLRVFNMRRNVFPLRLPWLRFLLPKSPRQRRKGMHSALWGP